MNDRDDIIMNDDDNAASSVHDAGPSGYWTDFDDPIDIQLHQVNLKTDAETDTGIIEDAIEMASKVCRYGLAELQDKNTARRIMKYVFTYCDVTSAALNSMRGKERRIRPPAHSATLELAARLISGTGDVAMIVNDAAEKPTPVLAYYSRTGPNAGVWMEIGSDDEGIIGRILVALGVSASDMQKKYIDYIKRIVPIEHYRQNTHLYPLADGLVAFQDGQRYFLPYLCDDGTPNPSYEALYGRNAYIVGKAGGRYNPGMPSPKSTCEDGFVWDPLTHMYESTDHNEDAMTVMLQSVLFGIRNYPGGYNFWTIDGSRNHNGGGGKSTTQRIIEAAVGGLSTSLTMDQLAGNDFYRGRIVGKKMINGDETRVGEKAIEGCEILKQIGRAEPVLINNKHQQPYEYAYTGIWYQAMNTDAPKILEKSDAFYRTIIPIPFPNTYTKNEARTVIKNEFAKSQEVSDWIVNYALDKFGDVQAYDAGAVSRLQEGIADIRAKTSSVFTFLDEYMADSTNSEIPLGILYRFYKVYAERGEYYVANMTQFYTDCGRWANMRGGWEVESHPNPLKKKYPWYAADRWISANVSQALNGLVSVGPGGRIEILEIMQKHRDRYYLVRNGAIQKMPQASVDPLSLLGDGAAYMAYRSAAVSLLVDAPQLCAGLDASSIVLSVDHWEHVGRPVPSWLVPGTAPGSGGFVIRTEAEEHGITDEGYAAVMRAGVVDVSVKFELPKFVAAAKA